MPRKILRRQPKTERGGETKEVIQKASAQILLKDGLQGFNTNAVAERAGISVGSLYQYYKNKDEILLELLETTVDRRLNRIRGALDLKAVFEPLDVIVGKLAEAAFAYDSEDEAKLERLFFAMAMNGEFGQHGVHRVEREDQRLLPLIKGLLVAKKPSLALRDLDAMTFVLTQSVRAICLMSSLPGYEKLKKESLKTELKRLLLGYLNALDKLDNQLPPSGTPS